MTRGTLYRQKFFDGDENNWDEDEHIEESWAIDDPSMGILSPNAQRVQANWNNGSYVIETLIAYSDVAMVGEILAFKVFLKSYVEKYGMKEALRIITRGSVRAVAEAVEWALKATKNPSSSRVLLGSTWQNGINYVEKAIAEDCTYYSLTKADWDKLVQICNGDAERLFAPNKMFIDQQWNAGKEFVFSHNPMDAVGDSFFEKEVLYLIEKGVKNFEEIGGGLWKAIK